MKTEKKFWKTGSHPIVGGRVISAGSTGNIKQFNERHPENKVQPKYNWK